MKQIELNLQELYNYIINFQNDNNFSPSIRQMMEKLNISSTSTIDYYLKKLEKRNLIKRNKQKIRSIHVVKEPYRTTIKIPTIITHEDNSYKFTPEDTCEQSFYMSKEFFPSDNIFYFTNKTSLLSKYNIFINDIVIVEKTTNFSDGNLCLVRINNEIQIKAVFTEKSFFRLENGINQSVYVKEFTMLGKVIGLYRKI